MRRAEKYLRAALNPGYWAALKAKVMPGVEHEQAIQRLAPRTLIDVGANKGQFSLVARHLFPDIRIHAFEPIASERAKLQSVVSGDITVHPSAAGRIAETREFFLTSRPDSSSLLKPAAAQKEAFDVSLVSVNTIEVVRLDEALQVETLPRPILLKLDVQGGELDVLIGAERALPFIDYIYCEVSFVSLYEGQPLAADIICYLRERGFTVAGVFNQAVTPSFGPTQADMLFSRAAPTG